MCVLNLYFAHPLHVHMSQVTTLLLFCRDLLCLMCLCIALELSQLEVPGLICVVWLCSMWSFGWRWLA